MSYTTKTWVDRNVEYPGRRKIVDSDTGEEATADLSREEGEIMEEGDAFSAANMNDLETRIYEGFTLEGISNKTTVIDGDKITETGDDYTKTTNINGNTITTTIKTNQSNLVQTITISGSTITEKVGIA